MIREDIVRRLVFIKQLYQLGVDQSRKPQPYSSVSLLSFHDAIEMYLVLVCEKENADLKPNANFHTYFDAFKKKTGRQLSIRNLCVKLNKARVNLKHYGTKPAADEIEGFRATAMAFFDDNTPDVFGIEFSEISLIDLVQNEGVRAELKTAQTNLANGKFAESIADAEVALRKTLDYFDGGSISWLSGSDVLKELEYSGGNAKTPREKDIIEQICGGFSELFRHIRRLGLGFDYQKYLRFCSVPNRMTKSANGSYHLGPSFGPVAEVTKEDAEFCLGFATDTAIDLQKDRIG